MEKGTQHVPMNANEYSDYLEHDTARLPNMEELQSREPIMDYYDQINPIDPRTSSDNWATKQPRKGFDMSDLNTYQVRDSDRLQAALFDRFILKDYAHQFPDRLKRDETLGKLINKKVGSPIHSFADIKRYGRHTLNGNTYTSVGAMEQNKIPY